MDDLEREGMKDLQKAARKEAKRLLKQLEKVPPDRMEMLRPVVENTAWMKAQLDRARDTVRLSEIVCEYDNGGGQTGIRETPEYKAYEALFKCYLSGMDRLLSALPAEDKKPTAAPDPEPAKTALEIVMRKKQAV